jgi:DtxR family transcriptional regulator, manganese transport regulator
MCYVHGKPFPCQKSMKPKPPAQSHSRIRKDHATETAEDYVEAIAQLIAEQGRCRIVDLAARFGVSHVTVTKTVARLAKEGLVITQPYGPMTLTEVGERMAAESKKRHEIVYQFLVSIGVSATTAADDAEGIEHHVSAETLRCFRRSLEK